MVTWEQQTDSHRCERYVIRILSLRFINCYAVYNAITLIKAAQVELIVKKITISDMQMTYFMKSKYSKSP